MSTGKRERFTKKKKNRNRSNHFSQVNDKEWLKKKKKKKKKDKRCVLTILMRKDVRNCRPTIAKISPSLGLDGSFGHRNGEYRSFILFVFYHFEFFFFPFFIPLLYSVTPWVLVILWEKC